MQKQIKLSKDLQDELLYGRAGYLWTCLFMNKHCGKDTIPATYMVGPRVKTFILCSIQEKCYFFQRDDLDDDGRVIL